MGRKYAKLQRVENNVPGPDGNREFLSCLRHALLLTLTEKGRLTAAQCRRAQEKLRKGKNS